MEPVEETCEEPLKESELLEIYADAFYEESQEYVNEDHERQTIQDEEALMEILAKRIGLKEKWRRGSGKIEKLTICCRR